MIVLIHNFKLDEFLQYLQELFEDLAEWLSTLIK